MRSKSGPGPADGEVARPEDAHRARFFGGGGGVSSTPSSSPRSPRSASSEASRPGPSVPRRWPGDREQRRERGLAVDQLEQLGVVRGHPHEPAVGAAQHEAQVPLVRLEPLRASSRSGCAASASTSSASGTAPNTTVAPASALFGRGLDLELEVAEPDQVACAQRPLRRDALTVDERAVGRPGVLDSGPLGLDHDPRVVARDRVALQADRGSRCRARGSAAPRAGSGGRRR